MGWFERAALFLYGGIMNIAKFADYFVGVVKILLVIFALYLLRSAYMFFFEDKVHNYYYCENAGIYGCQNCNEKRTVHVHDRVMKIHGGSDGIEIYDFTEEDIVRSWGTIEKGIRYYERTTFNSRMNKEYTDRMNILYYQSWDKSVEQVWLQKHRTELPDFVDGFECEWKQRIFSLDLLSNFFPSY